MSFLKRLLYQAKIINLQTEMIRSLQVRNEILRNQLSSSIQIMEIAEEVIRNSNPSERRVLN